MTVEKVSSNTIAHRKPTVVFLHGVGTTSIAWKYVLKYLDINRFHLVMPDLLGFGLSPCPPGCNYSVDAHTGYIHQTLIRMNVVKPFILVGHSMGSIIAANYCRNYSNEVKELILMSLPLYIKSGKAMLDIKDIQTEIFLRMHKFTSERKRFALLQSHFLRKIMRIDIEVNDKNWDSFRLSIKNTIIKQNAYDDLQNIEQPIKVIYGNLDEFLVQSNINALSKFRNIEVIKLSMVDHVIRTRFAKTIAKLINDIR